MAEPSLDCPSVVPVVGKSVATRVPQGPVRSGVPAVSEIERRFANRLPSDDA